MRNVKLLCLGLVLALGGVSAADLYLDNEIQTHASLSGTTVYVSGTSELHLTSSSAPLSGCTVHLDGPDAWLFFDNIPPSAVNSSAYLSQIRVNGAQAALNTNVRIVQYWTGTVVIPHSADYRPLECYEGYNFTGRVGYALQYYDYSGPSLQFLQDQISSFRLKRGYMATFAQEADGTGLARVYVAQDRDLNVMIMPEELDDAVSFVRVFPWRWVGKKGSCDASASELKADWWYNWNISENSTLDREYAAIRQQPYWPGLDQNWRTRGVNHLLGFNEPDNSVEDAYKNLNPPGSVDSAIAHWPALLATGLRVGAPAVTDGGQNWLFEFMDKADAAGLRVDYVPIHYYRCYSNNDYPAGAASQLYNFLKTVHDRTGRPVWVTEFNNGANWTTCADPSYEQNRSVIEAMITMMDSVPWIERYAVYSRVEYTRQTHYDGGGLTPMGVMYRDHVAPASHVQAPARGGYNCARYGFEDNFDDTLYYQNHASSYGSPTFIPGLVGRALEMDGQDDYIMLPENLADGDGFTFAGWVIWLGGGQWQRIFDFGANTSRYMFLTPASGANTLRFAITSGGGEQILETSPLAVGQLYHVAVTLSGSTGRLFVNGAQVAVNNSMTVKPSDLRAISNYIGKSHWTADPLFKGRLDEIYIGSCALTGAQIATLYNRTGANLAPVFRSDPILKADAVQQADYNQALIYEAVDMDETAAMLTFSKISGPDWLIVSSDGMLTGIPDAPDAGLNTFTVRVTDSAGAWDEATLLITVPSIGLEAHFAFEGSYADRTGHGYDAAPAGSPSFASGHAGQALSLSGGSYLNCANSAGLGLRSGGTVTAWVKAAGLTNAYASVVTKGVNAWRLVRNASTGAMAFHFDAPDNSEYQANGTRTVVDNTWHHLAAVYDGQSVKLYVDGQLDVSAAAGPVNATVDPVYIGSRYDNPTGRWWNGLIDEVRIYTYPLSAAQVGAVFAGNTAPAFAAQTIANDDAAEMSPYAGKPLMMYVTDVDGIDTLSFSKLQGPGWLSVNADGTLEGTPADSDVGLNTFTVGAVDPEGLSASAQMTVQVHNVYSGTRGTDDLLGLAGRWLMHDCTDFPLCGGADLTGDARVTLPDFAVLAENWLMAQ